MSVQTGRICRGNILNGALLQKSRWLFPVVRSAKPHLKSISFRFCGKMF